MAESRDKLGGVLGGCQYRGLVHMMSRGDMCVGGIGFGEGMLQVMVLGSL